MNCSSIHYNLSTSCSAALSSNLAFFPSDLIAPRHAETEQEASHALLPAVDYHNYMLAGEVVQPIFGLGVEKTVSLINELLKYRVSVGVGCAGHIYQLIVLLSVLTPHSMRVGFPTPWS
jgi:hypothetical protein